MLVAKEVVAERKVNDSVFNVSFDMPIRHSGKDVQNDVGEMNLDFRGDIWADTNLSHF